MRNVLESIADSLARHVRVPSAPRLWVPGRSTPIKKRVSVLHAWSWQTDPDGNVVWYEPAWASNILHNEGEQYILACAFNTSVDTPPANLYFGLDDRVTPAEGDALTDLSGEPSTFGYARQPVSTSGDISIALDSGDYQAVTATVTFTAAGGDWASVRNRFLCDVVSGTAGRLISTLALDTPRVVTAGSSLNTNYTAKLSE